MFVNLTSILIGLFCKQSYVRKFDLNVDRRCTQGKSFEGVTQSTGLQSRTRFKPNNDSCLTTNAFCKVGPVRKNEQQKHLAKELVSLLIY